MCRKAFFLATTQTHTASTVCLHTVPLKPRIHTVSLTAGGDFGCVVFVAR